jgi:hypothetical protein
MLARRLSGFDVVFALVDFAFALEPREEVNELIIIILQVIVVIGIFDRFDSGLRVVGFDLVTLATRNLYTKLRHETLNSKKSDDHRLMETIYPDL